MSRFKNLQGFYTETRNGSSVFPTLSITLLLYCFLLLIARHLGECSSQSLGCLFFVSLSCHTPHVAYDNFEDEIFLCLFG